MLTARRLAAWLGITLVLLAPAAQAATPTQSLRTFFARANAVLVADPDQPLEDRRRAVRELVKEAVDFRAAAALALGRQWLARTPAEQAEFASLFGDLWERAYVAAVGSKARVADGLSIRFLGESRDGSHTIVHTAVLTRAGSELAMDYRMRERDGRWTVRDVAIDGLSLAANYRAQFQRVLQAGGYAELLERMRAQADDATPIVAAAPSTPAVDATRPVADPADPVAPAGAVPVAMADVAPVATAVTTPAPSPASSPSAPGAATTAAPAPPPLVSVEVHGPPASAASATIAEPPRFHTAMAAAPARAATYWVQVGAYRSVEATSAVVNRLRGQAVTVLSALQRSGGRPEWVARVVVGPFPARAQAAGKVRELQALGYRAFIARSTE